MERMNNYLIDEIIEIIKDPKSRAFWEKAVRILGENTAAEELGELKHQMNTNGVREPAKYLTALFMKQMEKQATAGGQEQQRIEPEKLTTHFKAQEFTLDDLAAGLLKIHEDGKSRAFWEK